jgi:uncharacterized protein (DUF486 family)
MMPILRSAALLIGSNIFMTIAWYGHLRFRGLLLWQAILISWLLAFPEYLLQVPANRLGYLSLSGYQLKILQECITLVVFCVFAFFVLGEKPTLRYFISFALIIAAAFIAFSGKSASAH